MGVWQLIVIEAINDMELLIALSIGMMGALYGFIKLLRYKQINSFIALGDPLILAVLIPEVTASIVPVYMYIRDWMYRPDDFIYSYISTELAFWFGLIIFAYVLNKGKCRYDDRLICEDNVANKRKLYILYLILYFLIRGIYFYNCGGFPLLSDKYYTFFFEMSPVATRLSMDIYLIVTILWVDSLSYIKQRKMNYFIGALLVLSFVLSGQKGLITNVFKAFFFVEVYRFWSGKSLRMINGRNAIIVVVLALIVALIPLIMKSLDSENYSPIMAMLIRIIGNGDSFPLFYGLPQTSSILFENTGVFNYIWANLAAFHFHFDYIPTTELKWIMDRSLGEYVVPLIRHNLIAVKVFGLDFGWIYSLFVGALIGGVTRYVFPRISGINFYTYLIVCLIYEAVVECIAIYQVTLRFEPVIFNLIIILLFYVIFEKNIRI